ncbi:ABC transporter permease [Kibdelosporangium persicum]|uniref:ABC-type transport system involved in multi-copper enzyme maturation, permease component n=1 Tax=Kibdelosporangium persicum TaxID=2698649 RepID=A0ABX2EX02_9PSEU|nr:ABC transporter permease [Kibdelosporangium persicum]NRN63544.1 ABC-type transport system involved in multi-copper enzyme maturation, permease component [Kibdelosporangium persicum]
MRDVLSAEWLKIRTTRSSQYVLLAVVVIAVVGILLAYAWAQTWNGMSPQSRARLTDSSIEDTTAPLLHFCLGVLGVLIITGEYATGMIRTSLTVAPRRLTVLLSKAVVIGALAWVSGLLVTFSTYLVSRDILASRGFPAYAASFGEELPGLVGAGSLPTVIALVGLGLGAVLRSTAGALFAIAALVFIVPALIGFLPDPWDDRIGSLMLPHVTDPLVATGYVVVALGAAAVAMVRRDV